jgi:hypothetical protein
MAKGIFNRPNSVRRLGRYWKNRGDLPDAHWLANEIQNESDRTAIILFATLLDDTLITRLSAIFGAKLDSNEFDHIFRYEGPLGSFSSRIEISSLFKILDDITCEQLHCIREMRNACAHTKRPISFETPELLSVSKRLFSPRGFIKPIDDTRLEIRKAFEVEMLALVHIIIHGYKDDKRISFLIEFGKSYPGLRPALDVPVPSRDK